MLPAFSGRAIAALLFAAVRSATLLAPTEQARASDAFAAGVVGFALGSLMPRPVYVAPAYPVELAVERFADER